MFAIPHVGADDRIVQADLLDQLTVERVEVGFAGVEATARQRPHRGVRELEPHQQDVLVRGDQQRAYGLADPQLGHGSEDQSFGVSRRPSLNALYIP